MINITSAQNEIHAFQFQLTDSSIASTADYNDGKVILIDWAASWCPVCKANQVVMRNLYPEYSATVSFLSISTSETDTIELMTEMKASKEWDFALDNVERYSNVVGASNGHTWILNSDLTLFKSWGKLALTKDTIANTLNDALEFNGISATFEDLDQEISGFGVADNILFVGFVLVVAAAVIGTGLSRFRKQ